MRVKLGHAMFQRSNPKGTFSNWGLNEVEVRKMYLFQRKTGHISSTVRNALRLLLITYRK